MNVYGSSEAPKMKKIYHKPGCFYIRKIKLDNRMEMKVEQAEYRHFCECAYCGGLKGEVKVAKNSIAYWESRKNAKFTYIEKTDTLYIRTENGFWKLFRSEETGKYLLYHLNVFNPKMSFDVATHGAFHRQHDVEETHSLAKIVDYIIAHDRAKMVILDDYRKLPKHSKKQKKYYRAVEKKVKREERRRMDSLFAQIERELSESKCAYKDAAYC